MVGRIVDKALPPPLVTARPQRRRIRLADPTKSFALTFLMVALTAGFLAPILQAAAISIKTPAQLSQTGAPLLPSDPQTFEYQGKQYDVYQVPIDGQVRAL